MWLGAQLLDLVNTRSRGWSGTQSSRRRYLPSARLEHHRAEVLGREPLERLSCVAGQVSRRRQACVMCAGSSDSWSGFTLRRSCLQGQPIAYARGVCKMARPAVITGSSRGIAQAIARRVARNGFHVVVESDA